MAMTLYLINHYAPRRSAKSRQATSSLRSLNLHCMLSASVYIGSVAQVGRSLLHGTKDGYPGSSNLQTRVN